MHAQNQTFDYLIKEATVYDGKSWKAQKADVGMIKDRIVAVGDLKNEKAKKMIDGYGLILAPGFIDASAWPERPRRAQSRARRR